jgi:hypothetical protein
MRRTILFLSLTVIVPFTFGCASEAASESPGTGASAASDESAALVESAPVEEIAGSIDFPSGDFTADNASLAKEAVSSGMPIRAALEAVGSVAGAPNQVGSGVANWLASTADGGCLNLMLATGEGRVNSVSLDTFPSGSMGAAKCQNYGG